MNKIGQRMTTAVILAVFMISISGFAGVFGTSNTGSNIPAAPKAAYSQLADQNTIVDPRGQTVKQTQKLELGRTATLQVINPIDMALDVKGYKLISANIPLSLAMTMGMTFPLQASIGYDPYTVHNGTSFAYLMNLDNTNCTPYATLGVNMNFNMSALDFSILGANSPTMGDLGINFANINYQNSVNVPFFGVNTKIGDFVNYDIVNKYYSLDTLMSLVGLPAISDYGIVGGVGVSVNYRLHSWVTALETTSSRFGNTSAAVRWDSLGNQVANIAVDPAAQHGEVMTITVGNWVYHIGQEVTFTVWANIGLNIVGISLINQTFKYAYTQALGEVTFPETSNFQFVSHPQVLAGKDQLNTAAEWTAVNFNYNALQGGSLGAVGYNVAIPTNDQLAKYFTDMKINAAIGASLNVDFPFNIKSYYNARNAIPGSNLDYNVLVDSVGASSPNINYKVGGFLDLSQVKVLGYQLGNYSFNTQSNIFSAANLNTPFGDSQWTYDITNLVQLNQLNTMLNNYISSYTYGINPDIQFSAAIVLNLHGEMTGTMSLLNNNAGAAVTGATNFDWASQYDTQTTRINVPSSAQTGQSFDVKYSNMVYSLKVTPGIKLGVSVLGGIVGFDYTFMIPGVSQYLTQTFNAPDFTEHVGVQNMAVGTSALTVPSSVPAATNSVTGSFQLSNLGSVTDNYVISANLAQLPTGTTGQYRIDNGVMTNFGVATTNNLVGGTSETINYVLNLGPNAHGTDYLKNVIGFNVVSTSHPDLFSTISAATTLIPSSDMVSTQVNVESTIPISPGLSTSVPVSITNNGQIPVTYSLALVGADSNVGALSTTSMTLTPGQTGTSSFAINVAADPANTPGTHSLSVQIGTLLGTTTQSINYVVQNFSNPQMQIYQGVPPTAVVNLGQNPVYQFKLKNAGNVQETYNVAAAVDSGSISVNSAGTSQAITLSAGQETDVLVTLSSLTPGSHSFNVTATKNGEIVFSQNYGVLVKETTVGVMTSSYNYTTSPLTYTITVYNAGSVDDTFDVSIIGLDSSAYTLSNNNGQNIYIPAENAVPITMTIKPSDLSKVAGGVNPFFVGVESQTYHVVETNKYSAVALPIVSHVSVLPTILKVDNANSYDVSFMIQNTGNIRETFTVEVNGIDLPFIVFGNNTNNDGIVLTSTSTSVFASRGQTVLVTVEFAKAHDGFFSPSIVVKNNQGVVVQTISTFFGIGFVYANIAWIIVLGAIAIAGAVFAFVVYRRKEMNAYMTEAERATSQKGVLGRFSTKLEEHKKEVSTNRATKEMEKLAQQPAESISDSGWADAETVSLKPKVKSEHFSKVQKTLAEKRKEKE
jgi:hypothetical protein